MISGELNVPAALAPNTKLSVRHQNRSSHSGKGNICCPTRNRTQTLRIVATTCHRTVAPDDLAYVFLYLRRAHKIFALTYAISESK
jgi:hypothetical protein